MGAKLRADATCGFVDFYVEEGRARSEQGARSSARAERGFQRTRARAQTSGADRRVGARESQRK